MTDYRTHIAPIGNTSARIAELERVASEPHAVERVLVPAFEDPFPPLRHRAAIIISERMSPRLSERIAGLLDGDSGTFEVDTSNPDVRAAAALALDVQGISLEAFRSLENAAIADSSGTVRYHALMALHRNGEVDADHEKAAVAHALAHDRDAGVTVIACQAAAIRGWRDLADAVEKARKRLRGRDAFQAALALAELARMGGDVGLEAKAAVTKSLLEALEDEETLASAARALADLGITAAERPLKKIMQGWFRHPILKIDAAAALIRLGDAEGSDHFGRVMRGKRKDARGYAIQLSGELGLREFRDTVEREARGSGYHADTATIALAHYGDDDAWNAIREIADEHSELDVRRIARSLLNDRRGQSAE